MPRMKLDAAARVVGSPARIFIATCVYYSAADVKPRGRPTAMHGNGMDCDGLCSSCVGTLHSAASPVLCGRQ